MRGVTFFHSETGTEGGYWAFQDAAYMTKAKPLWPHGRVFDAGDPEREGTVVDDEATPRLVDGRPLPDPMVSDPEWARNPKGAEKRWGRRVYGVGEESIVIVTVEWEDGVREERSTDTLLATHWDYAGLHVLKDGDRLTIYSDATTEPVIELWSGEIKLRQYPLFTEDARGMWIHADQEGVDRDWWAEWFFREHPAELEPA